jgi:hypothetical protein
MDSFEEALQNIDVFCKVLVKKIVDNEENSNIVVEPIEKLLCRKYIIGEQSESNPSSKNLIPLPHLEKPLIDVVEDENCLEVLMQCRCKDQKVTVHTDTDGLKICKEECHTDTEGTETCIDECQKLNLPVRHLQIKNVTSRCNNNQVLEVKIPKTNTAISQG